MTHGSVEVRDWKPEDLDVMWDILGEWPGWWKGASRERTRGGFQEWWMKQERACMVATDQGEVIGFVYLDPIYPGQFAVPHIVKRKGYGNPRLILAITRTPGRIQRWFIDYDLHRLWTWTASRSAVQLAILLGFRVEGKARHYIKTDAGWLDAWQLSLLRSEAWKKTSIENMWRLLKWKCTG
jgi:RimJ/RimL family protein N-acetyltransferase